MAERIANARKMLDIEQRDYETSRRLYDWLQGATARQILREFGFTTPSESS